MTDEQKTPTPDNLKVETEKLPENEFEYGTVDKKIVDDGTLQEELKKQHNVLVNMFQDNQAMLAKIEELTAKKGKKK